MLEIRPSCEHCDKELPFDTTDAMVCTFECTFCKQCVVEILTEVYPNCQGGFERRPIRPAHLLIKYPVSQTRVYKPIVIATHIRMTKNIQSR